MKATSIHFFSPTDNQPPKAKAEKTAKLVLTGYISAAGKLVLPAKTVAHLGVDLGNTSFKVGMDQGKRKAKSLYLVPNHTDAETFTFEKAAKSYTLALPLILTKSGVDFAKTKYDFIIRLFEYEGTTAFELKIAPQKAAANAAYSGKPRGRKPKSNSVTE
ncbi:hypothetical protein [Spirosoma fluviale]|uniref:Uncharacterized protein n=1 Tax=Spirosoma fluviale TaxID=1597977 RepID=A0A286F6E0_9BACT|nr:hypothetical protein [Spirosoma fluviale]SOD78666.1 hypothetical protein SAMN06269250_0578 [Spirosoma fluviale]